MPLLPGPQVAARRVARALLLPLSPCPACGQRAATGRGCCAACWNAMLEPLMTEDLVALGRYRGPLGQVLRAAKFDGAELPLQALGAALGRLLTRAGAGELAVVPVPSHARRRARRAFDPAERLAAAAAPGHVVAALARVRFERAQSSISRPLREQNVSGAFAATPAARELRRRRVVLLDDVLTSGATARACAEALAAAEIEVALLAVAARAGP